MKKRSVRPVILITLAACLMYCVSAGIRSNYGVMINSICSHSGVPYASVSLVLAVAQLIYGVAQPLFSMMALRRSNRFVLTVGAGLMAVGLFGLPLCRSTAALMLFLGVLFPAGTGALSFGVIMSAISPMLTARQAATVSGIVNAGCGLGSMIFSPVIQRLLAFTSYGKAMAALGLLSLALVPVGLWLAPKRQAAEIAADKPRFGDMLRDALRSRSYWFLMIGFFTCGFHMAIIQTHLYSQFLGCGMREESVALAFSAYGAAGVIGSIAVGFLDSRFRMKNVLGSLYASRVVIILMLLLMPKTTGTMFLCAILLGATSVSTVPPTSGLVGRLFGQAKASTLFGVVFVSHQIGSFFSSWLGGLCGGNYGLIWAASILLSAVAAAVSFAVRE